MVKHHSVINHVTITRLLGQVNLGNSRVRIHHTKQCHIHHYPPICWVAVHPNCVFQCKGCFECGKKMIHEHNRGFKRNVLWEIKEKYSGCNNSRIHTGPLKTKSTVTWTACVRREADGEFLPCYNITSWSMPSK